MMNKLIGDQLISSLRDNDLKLKLLEEWCDTLADLLTTLWWLEHCAKLKL